MSTFLGILALVGIVLLFIGIIRVVFSPWKNWGSFFWEMLFLDLMGDVLEWLIDVAHDAFD
jgi:hypothetical protein